jgi:hypothetical protein
MAAWEIPGSRFARSGLRPTSTSLPPPHAGVGIFIVKNSRETMAARFCNRQFASPSAHAGALPDCVPRAATRTDSRFGLSETAWLWSPVFPCFFCKHDKSAARGRTRVRATKNPARSPARAAGVLSVSTLFWKILVTRVKRIMRGNLIWRSFLRFQWGRAPGEAGTPFKRVTPLARGAARAEHAIAPASARRRGRRLNSPSLQGRSPLRAPTRRGLRRMRPQPP